MSSIELVNGSWADHWIIPLQSQRHNAFEHTGSLLRIIRIMMWTLNCVPMLHLRWQKQPRYMNRFSMEKACVLIFKYPVPNRNLDIACCNLAQDLLFWLSFWVIVCSSKENARKEHKEWKTQT